MIDGRDQPAIHAGDFEQRHQRAEPCGVVRCREPGQAAADHGDFAKILQWSHRSAISWFMRSEEHTSELQSLMRISYAVFCLKKKIKHMKVRETTHNTI